MRRRTLFAILVVAALLALLTGAGWLARRGGNHASSRALRERLEFTIASGAESFDFASDDFAWDRMYVFGPYTTAQDVERSLGFRWPGFGETTVKSSDAVCLLLFTRGTSVIDWYEQPRTVDLSWLANGEGYDRSATSFRVDRSSEPVTLAEWATTKR